MNAVKYQNLSLGQVRKLAAELGKSVSRRGAIIGLSGNLGSGKTTFAKSLATGLGIKNLKSPTFIVSQRYPHKQRYLYHLDFYRLDDEKQLAPIGLTEILSSDNIVLIEWVDKFPKIARKCDILISFQIPVRRSLDADGKPEDKRDVTIKIQNSK